MSSAAETRPETAPPKPSSDGGNSTALDQWRGLALVFVLISHGLYFTNRVNGLGRVGVNLFFFISGILVFRSLSKPKGVEGSALAVGFWRRRLRRLYPALLTWVIAMLPVVYLLRNVPGAVDPEPGPYVRGMPVAVLYAVNFWPGVPLSLGHLWSLSCEMQFYLLAPVIFLLGGRTPLRRHLVWGFILLLLAGTGLLVPLLDREGRYKYQFEVAVWPMMLGFCCEYRKDWIRRFPPRLFGYVLAATGLVFVVIQVLMLLGMQMKLPVVALGVIVFAPCYLAYILNRPMGGPVGRTLTWLGERTYSIYLWQQPLTVSNYLPPALHLAGSVAAAFLGGLWFHWFERPFLSSSRKH